MTIKDAIPQRHMVRKYLSKPILSETVALLNTRIADHNARYGLNLKLVIGNSDGIGGMAKLLLMTKSVYNYIVLAGQDCVYLDEKLGYCGADLILVTGSGNNVTITAGNGHFSGIDLGIGKYLGIRNKWLKLLIRIPFSYVRLVAISG